MLPLSMLRVRYTTTQLLVHLGSPEAVYREREREMYGVYAAYQWGCYWHMSLPHSLINQQDTQLTHNKSSLQIY